ncbi:Venom carboxylesterase-6, partial [Gonioctena quinquepunctata]
SQPAENWNGVLDAKYNGKICYQVAPDNQQQQYEDCLYINVFQPIIPGKNSGAPVKLEIYGGGFTHGYATSQRDIYSYHLNSGIIVVSFNYRVGPFGFLSTGDEVIPGNMGLKDQLLAMKWVQNNIHLFGGDPNKVTISGQSAGGASVTYHIVSPQSKGLFRGAISSSGSPFCNWANMRSSGPEKSFALARFIDPTSVKSNTTQELAAFLRSVDAELIHATQTVSYVWAPVVEVEHPGAFISEPMLKTLEEGRINKVPLLIGFNSEERIAYMRDEDAFRAKAIWFDQNDKALVDGDMNIKDQGIVETLGRYIKKMYTAGKFSENLGALIRFLSDSEFIRSILRYGELQSRFTDVYVYEFSYHGILGQNNLTCEGCGRVGHGEETWYQRARRDLMNFPASDVTTLKRFVGILNNFVETLNPIPRRESLFQYLTWPTVTPDHFQYLDIDTDLSVRSNPRNETYKRWVLIYDKFAIEPRISF